MFYTYPQRKLYGFYAYDPDMGITRYVIIEAHSLHESGIRATRIGMVFRNNPRWSQLTVHEFEEPMIGGCPVDRYERESKLDGLPDKHMGDGQYEIFVHHLDGVREGYWK